MYFDKDLDHTSLKVTYSENYYCSNWCDLELHFDGEPCTVPGPIILGRDFAISSAASTFSATCTETRFGPIEAGSVHIGVYAEGFDLDTVYLYGPATLEVQEVTLR